MSIELAVRLAVCQTRVVCVVVATAEIATRLACWFSRVGSLHAQIISVHRSCLIWLSAVDRYLRWRFYYLSLVLANILRFTSNLKRVSVTAYQHYLLVVQIRVNFRSLLLNRVAFFSLYCRHHWCLAARENVIGLFGRRILLTEQVAFLLGLFVLGALKIWVILCCYELNRKVLGRASVIVLL